MTEPEAFPPVTLKTDDQVGLYFLCDEPYADEVREGLKADEVKFSLNPSEGAHLAAAGKVLFAFGQTHPGFVAEVLESIGEEVLIDPAVTMPEDAYAPPVKLLLSLGEWSGDEQRDYAALGLSLKDVPALIRMATDGQLHDGPTESSVVWSPIHAWWALAQLGAEEAIEPLVQLFSRADDGLDEGISEDLPRALAQFGASALAPLTDYLGTVTHGDWSRVAAAKAIGLVGTEDPEARAECVLRLSHRLAYHAEQSALLNAFLISPLLTLRAVEAMPLIERVFASGRVDETVLGDVEDVQIELGLKTKREHPRKPNALSIMGDKLRAIWQEKGLPLPTADDFFEALNTQPDADLPALDFESDVELPPAPYLAPAKVGRNEPCPCGSGKKYKKCCGP